MIEDHFVQIEKQTNVLYTTHYINFKFGVDTDKGYALYGTLHL